MPNITKPTGMSTIWASSGIKTAPTTLKIAQGYVVELPPYQTANYIENKQDQFNGHVNMHGLPQWDSQTEYQGGVSYTKGSNGTIYKSLVTGIGSDPINPLNSNVWAVAFEPFGSVAVVASGLATLQSSYNTLANLTSYPAARNNLSVYSKLEGDLRYALIAGNAAQVFSVSAATLGHHAVRLDQIAGFLTQATESTRGVAKLASALEMQTGTNNTNIVTPLSATTVFLKKSDNLASLASPSVARTNLGLGTIAVEAATTFLRKANNLSDLANTTTARGNLGLGTMALETASSFPRVSNNLSDLASIPAARGNLGLGTMALETAVNYLTKAGNLAGLANVITARSNLGLTSTATQPETYFLRSGNNLSDIPSVSTARGNLGLGTSAVLDVGTGSNSVAAGDDSRIVTATPTSRIITAGNGLTGGGNLTADRTLALGTPSTISVSSTNVATSVSHNHAFDINSFFGGRDLSVNGHYEFPGGFLVQWGTESVAGGGGGAVQGKTVLLDKPFSSTVYGILLTYQNTTDSDGDSCHARPNGTLDTFFLGNQGRANTVFWVALGV